MATPSIWSKRSPSKEKWVPLVANSNKFLKSFLLIFRLGSLLNISSTAKLIVSAKGMFINKYKIFDKKVVPGISINEQLAQELQ